MFGNMSDDSRRKLLSLKFIIGLIALVIIVLWLANLKNVWSFNRETLGLTNKWNWSELKADFNRATEEVNGALDEFKEKGSAELESFQGRSIERPQWLDEVLEKAEELASSSDLNLLSESASNTPAAPDVSSTSSSVSGSAGTE
jgi:hypothetical protein